MFGKILTKWYQKKKKRIRFTDIFSLSILACKWTWYPFSSKSSPTWQSQSRSRHDRWFYRHVISTLQLAMMIQRKLSPIQVPPDLESWRNTISSFKLHCFNFTNSPEPPVCSSHPLWSRTSWVKLERRWPSPNECGIRWWCLQRPPSSLTTSPSPMGTLR